LGKWGRGRLGEGKGLIIRRNTIHGGRLKRGTLKNAREVLRRGERNLEDAIFPRGKK